MPVEGERGPFADATGSGLDAPGSMRADKADSGAPSNSTDRRTRRHRLGLIAVLAAIFVIAVVVAAIQPAGQPGASPPRLTTSPPSPAAERIANAINLRLADLPQGFSIAAKQSVTVGGRPGARFNRCIGIGAELVAYVKTSAASADNAPAVSSPDFVQASPAVQEVTSSVAVEGSASLVENSLASAKAAFADQRLSGCLAHALDGVTYTYSDGQKIAFSNVAVSRIPVVATSANASLGIRVATTISGPSQSTLMYIDILGFAVGRDAISLTAVSIAQPFPTITEQVLSMDLVNRADAQPH